MIEAEFDYQYSRLVSVCGPPHRDKDMNDLHKLEYFDAVRKLDLDMFKASITKILQGYGRDKYEAKFPKLGTILGAYEDIKAGQSFGFTESVDMPERQRRQVAEMIRIDQAIRSLPEQERMELNREAAIQVLEPIQRDLCAQVKQLPAKRTDESNRDWAVKLAYRCEQLRDRLRVREIGDAAGNMCSGKLLVLACKELYEAAIMIKMREIAKERGVI